jgi:hypothetical protein
VRADAQFTRGMTRQLFDARFDASISPSTTSAASTITRPAGVGNMRFPERTKIGVPSRSSSSRS